MGTFFFSYHFGRFWDHCNFPLDLFYYLENQIKRETSGKVTPGKDTEQESKDLTQILDLPSLALILSWSAKLWAS